MKVTLISYSSMPCQTMALAAKTCYSESDALKNKVFQTFCNESQYWAWLLDACIKKGHYSPLEYSQFIIHCHKVPMTTVVQLRTHRHLSMQVQSMRYTGKKIADLTISNSECFYTRQDKSKDRNGVDNILDSDLTDRLFTIARLTYQEAVQKNVPYEVARDILPSCYLQDFVLSCNLRALFHIFSMRTSKDAQREIQELMALIYEALLPIIPDPLDWYKDKYYGKFQANM